MEARISCASFSRCGARPAAEGRHRARVSLAAPGRQRENAPQRFGGKNELGTAGRGAGREKRFFPARGSLPRQTPAPTPLRGGQGHPSAASPPRRGGAPRTQARVGAACVGRRPRELGGQRPLHSAPSGRPRAGPGRPDPTPPGATARRATPLPRTRWGRCARPPPPGPLQSRGGRGRGGGHVGAGGRGWRPGWRGRWRRRGSPRRWGRRGPPTSRSWRTARTSSPAPCPLWR